MLLDKALSIELRPGKVQDVVTVPQAARALLEWPMRPDTAKHRTARQAVLSALESMHDHRAKVKAREALEAAAIEAGLLRR